MSLRQTLVEAAQRVFNGIARGTLVKADDAHKWQEVRVRTEFGDDWSGVEVAHPYGFTAVAKPPADGKTSDAAECVVVFPDGDRSHPIVIAIGDRRYRLQNLQEGEVALHDDQGQKVHHQRDGILISSPLKITLQIAGGSSSMVMEKDKITITSKDIEYVKG